MYELCSLTGCPNDTHYCIVSKTRYTTDSPQAASFAVGLQNLTDLLFADVTMVVQGVEALIKSLMAMGTIITLATVWRFTVLMGVLMTAQTTFHRPYLKILS